MKVGPPGKTIRLLSAKPANSRNFSGIERSYLDSLPRICQNTILADLSHLAHLGSTLRS